MAEVLVNFTEPIKSKSGDLYYGRVLGKLANDGLWEGWIEFTLAGSDEAVTTRRETEQPNRDDLRYWAQGLAGTYLEGALDRALGPMPQPPMPEPRVYADSSPRSAPLRHGVVPKRIVLDPFQTWVQGEDLLRNQLYALSRDDLQNIVEAYRFSSADPASLRSTPHSALVDQIVNGVRARYAASGASAAGTESGVEAGPRSATAEDRSA